MRYYSNIGVGGAHYLATDRPIHALPDGWARVTLEQLQRPPRPVRSITREQFLTLPGAMADDPPDPQVGAMGAEANFIHLALGGGGGMAKPKDVWKDMDVSSIPEGGLVSKMRPFFLDYQHQEEANLRLSDSIILVKSQPVFITQVHWTGKNKYIFGNCNGENYKIPFTDSLNLRTPPPGYYTNQKKEVVYLSRVPARVFKQGLYHENTHKKPVGDDEFGGFRSTKEIQSFLYSRVTHRWDTDIAKYMATGLIERVLLSSDIVAFHCDGKAKAEYKGRVLGDINGNTVLLDPDDNSQSWIHRALHLCGLQAKETTYG